MLMNIDYAKRSVCVRAEANVSSVRKNADSPFADRLLRLLAYNTSLGQALIGKEEGEEVEVDLPTGHTRVLIVSLSPDSAPVIHARNYQMNAR